MDMLLNKRNYYYLCVLKFLILIIVLMNIINLTTEGTKYNLVPDSILKMDSALMECNDSPWMHLSLFQEITEGNNSFPHNSNSFAYQYANRVPVFFVTHDLAGKTFNVEFLGHTLSVKVPSDSQPATALEADARTILNSTKKGVSHSVRVKNSAFEPLPYVDPWGIYIGAAKNVQNLSSAQPMIFIWVDEIYDFVQQNHKGDSNFYNILTCQAILHEMMHALMDINILASSQPSNVNIIPEWFRLLREESLAEAGSLMMMDGVWTKTDVNYLSKRALDPRQLFQYRLGCYYYKAGTDVVNLALENWIEREYNQKLAEDWLMYVKGSKIVDKQLALYDKGFAWPYVFKYQSSLARPNELILYSDEDLVKKVIRDYAEKNKPTKSALMAAFPNNLNNDYEVFIDPLVKDHFTDKNNPSDTRPIYEDHEVICTDGKLIICDYWHPNSLPPFVNHARTLGFNIIDFLS